MSIPELQTRLRALGDPAKAEFLQKYFKTAPGEYGAGDIFLGVTVPQVRKLAASYKLAAPDEVLPLLTSSIHEDRLLALLLLVRAYAKANEAVREQIYRLYLKRTAYINNWDLVDTSASHIVGAWLCQRDKAPLTRLARSTSLWERRIAIIATHYFIRRDQFSETLRLALLLLTDKEDLMHKAVGWMLREVGKRDVEAEEGFLQEHYQQMPRTMLRYAIERFPEARRRAYLTGEV